MSDCLDSWALLRWLEGVEAVTSRIEDALQHQPVMSWINNDLLARLLLDEATPRRILEAAALKAAHPMAYADAFAVATAQAHGATLLTGDPEILDGPQAWVVEDLRSP